MENEVYKGQIVRVTEEVIEGIKWERVYLPAGVVIFPITDEGKIILIEEKRPHETPPVRLKTVSGMIEPKLGSITENAQRELQEEIGFKAQELEHLMTINGSGTVNHEQYFFIARGLIPSKLPNPDGEDTILGTREFTLEELKAAILTDQLKWSMSTLGMFRLIEKLDPSR